MELQILLILSNLLTLLFTINLIINNKVNIFQYSKTFYAPGGMDSEIQL